MLLFFDQGFSVMGVGRQDSHSARPGQMHDLEETLRKYLSGHDTHPFPARDTVGVDPISHLL